MTKAEPEVEQAEEKEPTEESQHLAERLAIDLKERGNAAFRDATIGDDKRLAKALLSYTKATELLQMEAVSNPSLESVLQCNSAAVCIRLGRYEQALTFAEDALHCDPTSVKARIAPPRLCAALGPSPKPLGTLTTGCGPSRTTPLFSR